MRVLLAVSFVPERSGARVSPAQPWAIGEVRRWFCSGRSGARVPPALWAVAKLCRWFCSVVVGDRGRQQQQAGGGRRQAVELRFASRSLFFVGRTSLKASPFNLTLEMGGPNHQIQHSRRVWSARSIFSPTSGKRSRVSFKTLKILLSNSPRGRELQSKDWQKGLGKLVGQAGGRAAAGGGEERKVFEAEE